MDEPLTLHGIETYRLDHAANSVSKISDVSKNQKNLETYIRGIANTIVTDPDRRKYAFSSDTIEIKTLIDLMVKGGGFAEAAKSSSERLLRIERDKEKRYIKLKGVQKGILIHAYFKYQGSDKIIICKAENTDFLEDGSFDIKSGYSMKRQIYKALLVEFDSKKTVTDLLIYDSHASNAKYWWSDFLELLEINTDEVNTETAFTSIDRFALSKIKDEYPSDYIFLRNMSLRFFRTRKKFSMQKFVEEVIDLHQSMGIPEERVQKIKEKVTKLPAEKGFDSSFTIAKNAITAREMKVIVPLTDEIDLNIKEHVVNLDEVIVPDKSKNGDKYIRIKTDKGFDYFSKKKK